MAVGLGFSPVKQASVCPWQGWVCQLEPGVQGYSGLACAASELSSLDSEPVFLRGLPWWPSGCLPLDHWGMWVQPLVGELRSHVPRGQKRKT